MTTTLMPSTAQALRCLVTHDGLLRLSIESVPVPTPGPGEVLIRVEAAPLNPSDLALMLAPADPATIRVGGSIDAPTLEAQVPPAVLQAVRGRWNQPLPAGNEGAGTVIAAGAEPAAQALLGRRVAALDAGMFAQYRCVPAAQCLPLPDHVDAAQGAAALINPLTALCMIETMRREGHSALVHTVGASNLGHMLTRLCLEEGIALVNIVRRPTHAAELRAQGALHVCDSSAPSFAEDLHRAIEATGATLAFDAIGGGALIGQILNTMEAVQAARSTEYSRYGTAVMKQVYVYGHLDPSATVIERRFGLTWGVAGWLLFVYLRKLDAITVSALYRRIAAGLTTTFASHYQASISLTDLLRPDLVAQYARVASGAKFLVEPQRG